MAAEVVEGVFEAVDRGTGAGACRHAARLLKELAMARGVRLAPPLLTESEDQAYAVSCVRQSFLGVRELSLKPASKPCQHDPMQHAIPKSGSGM
eukprot:scaffold201951_cov38-Prasinocladus_malaysianus.AAC.1